MNGSLVPANAKKSMLIAGFLRPMPDLAILITGCILFAIIFLVFKPDGLITTICSCIPTFVCVALIVPIPNYHNVLVALGSILKFYNNRRNYIWKGWCVKDEFK